MTARFEPAITAIELQQTYALDRTATGIGIKLYHVYIYRRKRSTCDQNKKYHQMRDFRLPQRCNVVETCGLLGHWISM